MGRFAKGAREVIQFAHEGADLLHVHLRCFGVWKRE